MSKEAAVKFLTSARSSDVEQQLRSLDVRKEADQTKLLSIAAKEGYEFSIDDFRAAAKDVAGKQQKTGAKPRDLSESELEGAAGGMMCARTCTDVSGCGNSFSMFC